MKNFSIIVTCVNETSSLNQTVKILFDQNEKYIKELIIVYPKRVSNETLSIVNDLSSLNNKIIKLKQSRPHVGGAVQDAFDLASGEYVVMMAGDLETDPNDVRKMIEIFNSDSDVDVVTASRWNGGGKFNGYGASRVLYNYFFNKIFAILYGVKLTDMTFGYRAFKTNVIKNIKFDNYKHSFFFETILKAININCKIVEIPTNWEARKDGEPQISRDYFNFILIGLKYRFIK